jgi:hypothetical protein
MTIPVVFISYSHDSPEHKAWVLKLATRLVENGVDTILDQWALSPGQDLSAFMQNGVTKADRVILVCTNQYVAKADGGQGGVGYERLIVTSELVQNIDTKKFLPIVRNNELGPKTPLFLGPRLHIDFSGDQDFNVKLEDLLRELHGAPALTKPPLGPNPFSGMAGPPSPREAGPTGLDQRGEPLLDESWFTTHGASANERIVRHGLIGCMELRYALHQSLSKSQLELLTAVQRSEIRTFGWPIGVLLGNHDEYKPRPTADGIRAEVAIPEKSLSGRPSYDYWALRSNGDFYLLQSLFEDQRAEKMLFFNTRIVRIAESLLFAVNLYRNLGVPSEVKLSIRITHRGLAERTLGSSSPNRQILPAVTYENASQTEFVETLSQIQPGLVDHVRRIAEPLFMLFDFKQFSPEVYSDIVAKFEQGQVT